MTVELPAHPAFETDVITPSPGGLSGLAADYRADAGDGADVRRFLFGFVPIAVFDDLFGGADAIEGAHARWMLHLSGYFGGRWLRSEIAAAQPEAPLVSFSVEPTEVGFAATMARAQRSLDAADASSVDHAASSLLDQPADDGGEPRPGLTDSFGYNAGYNLEILASPPEGVRVDPAFEVELDGLLRCRYATPKLAALGELETVAAALNEGADGYGPLAESLAGIQVAAVERGREVWSTGLSVQGFGQDAYDQLLDVSSSFLETVQATALTMVRATVERDAVAAATGARAEAAMIVWLDAYMAGLVNGEGEMELPRLG